MRFLDQTTFLIGGCRPNDTLSLVAGDKVRKPTNLGSPCRPKSLCNFFSFLSFVVAKDIVQSVDQSQSILSIG